MYCNKKIVLTYRYSLIPNNLLTVPSNLPTTVVSKNYVNCGTGKLLVRLEVKLIQNIYIPSLSSPYETLPTAL